MLKKWLCVAAAMLGLNAAIDSARAQNYPARAITLVIPFAPGGSTSIVGRGIADKMSELLGEKVVVDNRPGAGSGENRSRTDCLCEGQSRQGQFWFGWRRHRQPHHRRIFRPFRRHHAGAYSL